MDLTNHKFGRLRAYRAEAAAMSTTSIFFFWLCVCACGTEKHAHSGLDLQEPPTSFR
jgi:hypothetical protein